MMRKRNFYLILVCVMCFACGYFNEYIAPYFLSYRFVCGTLFVLLAICFAALLHLKKMLKVSREYNDRLSEDSAQYIQEIHRKIMKEK